MSASLGGGSSKSKSQSSQESNPLTAKEVNTYWDQLNQNTGGRLNSFAQNGTQAVNYQQMTPEQLQAIGGAGATRRAAVQTQLETQLDDINSDSSLTYAQRQRARQMSNDSATSTLDGINQEVEASLAALAQAENKNQYASNVRNSELSAKDLDLLARIYYSGKGQKSKGSSSGNSSAWNFNTSGSLG